MAREAVDAGAQLEPALPVRQARDGAPVAAPRRAGRSSAAGEPSDADRAVLRAASSGRGPVARRAPAPSAARPRSRRRGRPVVGRRRPAVDRPVERDTAADREVRVAGRGSQRRSAGSSMPVLGIDPPGSSAGPRRPVACAGRAAARLIAGSAPRSRSQRDAHRGVARPALVLARSPRYAPEEWYVPARRESGRFRLRTPPVSTRRDPPDPIRCTLPCVSDWPDPTASSPGASSPTCRRSHASASSPPIHRSPPSGRSRSPGVAPGRSPAASSPRRTCAPVPVLRGEVRPEPAAAGVVELAHRVGQAALAGERRGARDGRLLGHPPVRPQRAVDPLPRPGEELARSRPRPRGRAGPSRESYVSSAFATRSTSGRGNPSA